MSLIRARKRRKASWMEARKGMPRSKLIGFLFLVLVAIWYLGWAF
jgi:hypothetical protein